MIESARRLDLGHQPPPMRIAKQAARPRHRMSLGQVDSLRKPQTPQYSQFTFELKTDTTLPAIIPQPNLWHALEFGARQQLKAGHNLSLELILRSLGWRRSFGRR